MYLYLRIYYTNNSQTKQQKKIIKQKSLNMDERKKMLIYKPIMM